MTQPAQLPVFQRNAKSICASNEILLKSGFEEGLFDGLKMNPMS